MLTACNREKLVSPKELPLDIIVYVEKTYPDVAIIYVKEEVEWFKKSYEVKIENGLKLKFNAEGVPVGMEMDD
jgi:predicted GTPase